MGLELHTELIELMSHKCGPKCSAAQNTVTHNQVNMN